MRRIREQRESVLPLVVHVDSCLVDNTLIRDRFVRLLTQVLYLSPSRQQLAFEELRPFSLLLKIVPQLRYLARSKGVDEDPWPSPQAPSLSVDG
jgi:hypothetical protein